MKAVRIEGAVPGSYVEIAPSGSGDWHLRVCEGYDADACKGGEEACLKFPVGVKLYGSGKTSNNTALATELMRALAEFYQKHVRSPLGD
jgi:hypothetical protein